MGSGISNEEVKEVQFEKVQRDRPVVTGWVPYDCPTQDMGETDAWSCGECSEPAEWCLPDSSFVLLRCHDHVPRKSAR